MIETVFVIGAIVLLGIGALYAHSITARDNWPRRAKEKPQHEDPYIPPSSRPEPLERGAYGRWHHSADWNEVILPYIEWEEGNIQRMLILMDPRDTAEVAMWQGQLRMLEHLRTRPERVMEQTRKEEERIDDGRRREDRRAVRRLLSWTRGR